MSMKKVWKKLIPLLAVMSLAAATGGVTAGATDSNNSGQTTLSVGTDNVVDKTETVTISEIPEDAESLTFATYQILYATYDSTTNNFEYHLTAWAESVLVDSTIEVETSIKFKTEESAIAAIQNLGTNGNTTTEQRDLINALASATVDTTYASALADATISDAWSSYKAKDETVTTNLAVGAYLVIPTSSNMAFLNMMVSVDAKLDSNANNTWKTTAHGAVLKGTLNGITKQVSDDISDEYNPGYGDDASVGIGDIVYYAITANVPQFPANSITYEFKITDTPTNVSINLSTVQVYGVDAAGDKTPLTAYDSTKGVTGEENYKVSVDDTSGVLTVDFSNYYLDTFYSSETYTYKSVYITYNAEVLSSAYIATGNENTAKLSYGSSYTTTVASNEAEDKTKVYTYGAVLTKTDDGTTPTALANATFQVSDGSTTLKFVVDGDSTDAHKIYRVADVDDTVTTTDIITGTDGTITIIGLDAGKAYTVKETKAPSGYSLNTNYITVTISAETDDTSGALTGNVASVSSTEYTSSGSEVTGTSKTWKADATDTNHTAADAYMYMSVTDTTLGTLPATGSIGIIVFTIAGVAIMILALILINGGKSKEKAGQGMRK
ncbi:MAG: isopeptide-forming domain-containing fimbrial protein [Lachnospiraceae bacterium]|nr:isopeptide-forming domain-containing fimbrial protein [Lachnospiraceae bacterium]